jgi:hypothetical protein
MIEIRDVVVNEKRRLRRQPTVTGKRSALRLINQIVDCPFTDTPQRAPVRENLLLDVHSITSGQG